MTEKSLGDRMVGVRFRCSDLTSDFSERNVADCVFISGTDFGINSGILPFEIVTTVGAGFFFQWVSGGFFDSSFSDIGSSSRDESESSIRSLLIIFEDWFIGLLV